VEEYPGFLAGGLLADLLQEEDLQELLDVHAADSEAAARAAVDEGRIDLAVIIPPGFTASLFGAEEPAGVEIYHDPALTLGPAVIRDVVTNFLDGFNGSLIAADTADRVAAQGSPPDTPARLEIMQRYGEWIQTLGESLRGGNHPGLRYADSAQVRETDSVMKARIGPILAGMMIFFAFFVGALAAQSILREQEQGTLARLYRTPLPARLILFGKFAAVAALLALQEILLIAIGFFLFGIEWGEPLPLLLNGLGLALAAGGFGILLISFMKTTRQAFLVMGGAVILTGMAGGTMTTWFAELPPLFEAVNLFTPQGWVLRGFLAGMRGAGLAEAALPAAAASAIGLCFLWIGLRKLAARYA
jgi:ABC-2 type transport system permease protein